MSTDKEDVISRIALWVKQELTEAETGHDWFHIERVWNNTKLILQKESADEFVTTLAVLLHDIDDHKFTDNDQNKVPSYLKRVGLDQKVTTHVIDCIDTCSFSVGGVPTTIEAQILQDADRLDAMGAIGIARAFTYGGFKKRVLYDPSVSLQNEEKLPSSEKTTINHFYEKLLTLKDLMHTQTAKQIAHDRHDYMLQFLDQFRAEWYGEK